MTLYGSGALAIAEHRTGPGIVSLTETRAVPLATTAAALGLTVAVIAVAAPGDADGGRLAVRIAAGALPIGFGLWRLARDRTDRFALLVAGAGALYMLTLLAELDDSVAYSAGRAAVWLVEAALVYLLLAFPHGRLKSSAERWLAAAVAALVATLFLPAALLAPYPEPTPWSACGQDCPANAFIVGDGSAFVDGFMRPAREVLAVVLFGCVAAVLARRASRASELQRRVLTPVVAIAVLRMVALAVYFVARSVAPSSAFADALGWLYVLSLPLVTLAFAGGLLAHRVFVGDALERLADALPTRPRPRELRVALSSALRDPRLEVLYWVPESRFGWVEETGWPVGPPVAGDGRAVTDVVVLDRRVAAIVHDAELAHDEHLMHSVAAFAVTVLENQQLVDQLSLSLRELTESRARLVTVADEERHRIERDLHDGAQQRLVALQIQLELLAERIDGDLPEIAGQIRGLEDDVATTLNEVRNFGRGVYPAVLADRGLGAALHAVARSAAVPTTVDARLPHRYPREVESAVYFACLEAMQNAAKHGDAKQITIEVSGNAHLRFDVGDDGTGFDADATPRGAGLTNMRDRVGAVGGTLEIASAPGRGTHVIGTIPVNRS